MDSALLVHRLHFAFTVTFHYLFPQLTMGLAPLIVVLKTLALRRNDVTYNRAARFWARVFGINFVLGVVAVRAQHERRSHHRGVCHGIGRRVLFALGQARKLWPDICSGRSCRRLDFESLATLSHGRWPGQDGGFEPARDAGSNGRAIPDRAGSAHRSDRAAERRRA